jgi:hypothetical protein
MNASSHDVGFDDDPHHDAAIEHAPFGLYSRTIDKGTIETKATGHGEAHPAR